MEGFITRRCILVERGKSEALVRADTNHKNTSVSISDCYYTDRLPWNNTIRKYQKALEQSIVYDSFKCCAKPIGNLS